MTSESSLLEPRTASAWQIPDVVGGRFAPVRLLRVDEFDVRTLEYYGAINSNGSWFIERRDSFPFEGLEYFLPRCAQRSIVPEIVDLIPSSSWFASLANLLTPRSWKETRLPHVDFHKGCQDCGYGDRLEAHELWSYDEDNQIQTLEDITVLCRLCHDTRHLGRAFIRGKFEETFNRLCKINRIYRHEREAYIDLVNETWERRSKLSWQLDIRFPPDHIAELRPSIIHDGDGWLIMPASGDRPERVTRVINVGVGTCKGKTVLVGLHHDEIEQAYSIA